MGDKQRIKFALQGERVKIIMRPGIHYSRTVKVAVAKLSYSHTLRSFYGFLTPSEILALVAEGIQGYEQWKIDYVLEKKRKGISNPIIIFYFTNLGA